MLQYLPVEQDDPEEQSLERHMMERMLSDDGPSFDRQRRASKASKTWVDWALLFLSLVVLASASVLFSKSSHIPTPRYAAGLRRPDQYPGLDLVGKIARKKKGPLMIFPGSIIRANKAMPDEVYEAGSHVVLSESDSMFYQWTMRKSLHYKQCYFDAVVSSPEELRTVNKSYTSTGDLTRIQIWNVTTPPGPLTSLSWTTRPERVSLLGTVAFFPDTERRAVLGYEDGWPLRPPTPRFACGVKRVETIEVACEACTLEFDQIFETIPLAFDLLEIG